MIAEGRWLATVVFSACISASCASVHRHDARAADEALLARTWAAYKHRFVRADGRVVRPEHGDDTVSEGQGYAMLRAAWMDDRATFDRVWTWARTHLSRTGRPQPALMAWHFGDDGGEHVIDWNAATDADTDAAMALLVASERWPRDGAGAPSPYRTAAAAILQDLLELTVVDEAGHRVLLAGNWADHRRDGRGLVLNPSYFAPAFYREFAQATGDARWIELVRGSYVVLDAVCRRTKATLGPNDWQRWVPPMPDWVRWSSPTVWEPERGGQPSWDAVRIPWRIGTDWAWSRAAAADDTLNACLRPVAQARLARQDGERPRPGEPLGFFALGGGDAELANVEHPLTNAMFAFALADPRERDRLLAILDPSDLDVAYFGDADRYYVNSLAYLPFLARAGRHRPPGTPPP